VGRKRERDIEDYSEGEGGSCNYALRGDDIRVMNRVVYKGLE